MQPQSAPKISIIIPVYNSSSFIDITIKHILNQTFQAFEVILVDDGSTDDSGEICEKYALIDPRFKVVHKRNEGVSKARNAGIEEASADYICFCDSDDYYHPQFLEILYKAIVESHEDVVFCKREYVDKVYPTEPVSNYNISYLSRKEVISTIFERFQLASANTKIYRRDYLTKEKFKFTAAEDVEFVLRYLRNNERALVIDASLYYYLQREGSILHSDKMPERVSWECDSWLYIYDEYFKNVDDDDKSAFLRRIYRIILSRFIPYKSSLYVKSKINKLVDNTIMDYRSNKYIPLYERMCCLAMIKMPFLSVLLSSIRKN